MFDNPSKSSDKFVTTSVAATMLNVSLRTIQLWVESGVLSAWKTAGGHRKVSVSSIEATLLKRKASLNIKSSNDFEEDDVDNDDFSILLVEDDEGLRQLFQFYFMDWKYKVKLHVVSNGFDGLISLGSRVPDLLITDLNMPGLNGFDLLKHLNQSKQFKKLDIAVITALTLEDFPSDSFFTDKIKIFFKPLDFDLLEEFITPIIVKKLG